MNDVRYLIAAATILLSCTLARAECGVASWYDYSGHRTASGERFPTTEMTLAHRTLPFDTIVRVTDQRTGRSVVARVNDRGPFVRGRVADLSPRAARALGGGGLWRVCLTVVGPSRHS